MKSTVSAIKADVGSLPGHVKVPDEMLDICEEKLTEAEDEGIIKSHYVTNCGDDINLIMCHDKGTDNDNVHGLVWDTFKKAGDYAEEHGFYGANQDLLKEAFSGNVKGMGPGVAEFEIEERPSEPIIVWACDKTAPSAFNLPIFKMFGSPFNTAGLIIDSKMHSGYKFEIHDIRKGKKITLESPEEMHDILSLIGLVNHYVIKRVYRKSGEVAASISTEKLSMIAGEYVGKDDPVAITRAQSGYPAVGEQLEAFAFPHLVPGWMRGSHQGPLMPVSQEDAKPTRFDGPPRVIALGFQLKNGILQGPEDLFDDPSFDEVRRKANEISGYMRRHGPFQPHLLPEEELEYTTLTDVIDEMEDRFEPIQ